MEINDITPSEKENNWAAFLNGEPDSKSPSRDDEDGFHDFEQTWELAGTAFCHESANTDAAWGKLQNSMKSSRIRLMRSVNPWLRYAAGFILILGIGFVAQYFISNTDNQQIAAAIKMVTVTTSAHPEDITTVALPDGSIVQLNANSKLEYPEKFSAQIRKVNLSGEAYFQVAHDSTCPFVIDTEGASVEVLGTSFNVSAYPGKPNVEVNVETGKVRLTEKNPTKQQLNMAILIAGKSGKVNLKTGGINESDHLSPNYLAWITKEIQFQRTPLAEAFGELENVYHVKISVVERDIEVIPYTANFAKLKLDYIIDVIARTHNLSVTKNGDTIVFARKK